MDEHDEKRFARATGRGSVSEWRGGKPLEGGNVGPRADERVVDKDSLESLLRQGIW